MSRPAAARSRPHSCSHRASRERRRDHRCPPGHAAHRLRDGQPVTSFLLREASGWLIVILAVIFGAARYVRDVGSDARRQRLRDRPLDRCRRNAPRLRSGLARCQAAQSTRDGPSPPSPLTLCHDGGPGGRRRSARVAERGADPRHLRTAVLMPRGLLVQLIAMGSGGRRWSPAMRRTMQRWVGEAHSPC